MKKYFILHRDIKALSKDVRGEITRKTLLSWYGFISGLLMFSAIFSFTALSGVCENIYIRGGIFIILAMASSHVIQIGNLKNYLLYKEKEANND